MTRTVVVTGGSGFLGRRIVAEAEAAGHRVFAPARVEFDLETGTGRDACLKSWQRRAGEIDVIIHAAAYYGGIGINQAEPANLLVRNLRMALTVFEAARDFGVGKVLPVGSACAYPGHLEGDLREGDFWSGALHPSVEAYGISKKIQLVAQRAFHRQHGIASNHLILTNLYGPDDVFTEYRSHVVSSLIKKFSDARIQRRGEITLWGDGSPVRDFMHVGDAAGAVVAMIEAPHDPEPINVSTGVGTSIRELATVIAELTGYDGRIRWDTSKPNGVARKVLSPAKMRRSLGFTPRWSLREGLAATIAWYAANKDLADARA